jgi:cellobiose-specific phosphotransferase system component IIC
MPRFEKTPLHVASAVLILLGLYALAGLGYALWMNSGESAMIWSIVAVLAFIASAVYQRVVRNRRRRAS